MVRKTIITHKFKFRSLIKCSEFLRFVCVNKPTYFALTYLPLRNNQQQISRLLSTMSTNMYLLQLFGILRISSWNFHTWKIRHGTSRHENSFIELLHVEISSWNFHTRKRRYGTSTRGNFFVELTHVENSSWNFHT